KSSRGRHSSSRAHSFSSTAAAPVPTWPPVSFLFIVNELPTNDDPEFPGSVEARLVNGRWLPPEVMAGYSPQTPGHVYRWFNGVVSLAEGYQWVARPIGNPVPAQGTIFANGTQGPVWPTYYSAATVFFCNPFDQFFTARGDASTRDMSSPEDWWQPLGFRHDNSISRADHAGDYEHLAVRSASWINQLVPSAYRRQSNHGSNQGGLGGLLPIVIALIAFSCTDHDELYRVLIHDRAWAGNVWTPHERNTGRISRRGLVCTVFLDPENTQGSTNETVEAVEEGNIPIFR
ncbi:hypothetical protein LOCC1_G007808, partial [Lachnellula occidentalis]